MHQTLKLIQKAIRSPFSYLLHQIVIRARQIKHRLRLSHKPNLRQELSTTIEDFFSQMLKRDLKDMPGIHFEGVGDDSISAAADLLCKNKMRFLGSDLVDLGDAIDWQRDFKNNGSWPMVHISKIAYAYAYNGMDPKIPWELTRFQYLSNLGRAFQVTHQERYAKKGADLITDWINQNPMYVGINWRCPMDLAIQSTNWLLAWHFFKNTTAWKAPEFRESFFQSLLEHGVAIAENLELGPGFNSNHFLADLTGLLFISLMCPEFRRSQAWLDLATKGLEQEIHKQIYDDGADFEGSIPYHRLVCEFFGYAAWLMKREQKTVSQEYMQRLEAMFEFVFTYTKTNGLAPQIGDADDGRLFIFDDFFNWERRDHRHLFTLARSFFPSNKKFAHKEPTSSRAFHDCGIYIMRNADLYCIVDAGPNGQKGNGGHGHNDMLSFELNAFGEDIIIDPGTYVYTSSPPDRNHFRSTKMHNTVTVDEQEMNRFRDDTLFSLIEDAQPTLNRWDSNESNDLLDAEHTGYDRIGARHRRIFDFDKKKNTVRIIDEFRGHGNHFFEWNFHCDRDVAVTLDGDHTNIVRLSKGETSVLFEIPEQLTSSLTIREDSVSPSYGIRYRASVITLCKKMNLPSQKFVFSLKAVTL